MNSRLLSRAKLLRGRLKADRSRRARIVLGFEGLGIELDNRLFDAVQQGLATVQVNLTVENPLLQFRQGHAVVL